MPKRKSQQSIRSQKPGRLDPRHYSWNVFNDFSAYQTYFTLLVIAYVLYAGWNFFQGKGHEVGAASLITFSSLLPVYLWTRGSIQGLPIYPIYSFTYLYTFALQIINRDRVTDVMGKFTASPSDLWASAAIVSACLLAGTLTWFLIQKKQQRPPDFCHSFRDNVVNQTTLALFIASTMITLGFATEKIYFLGKLSTAAQAFAGTLSTVTGFVLAYRLARNELATPLKITFIIFLILNLIANSASLLLIGAISLAGTVLVGYTLGKKKVPWLALVLFLPLAFILHEGKGEMRVKYWNQQTAVASVSLTDYPTFFMEWFDYGWGNITEPVETVEDERSDLLERSGLIQILLVPYFMSPDILPYVDGETYKDLPLMLIPRIFYPDKPIAHAGQRYLSVYYMLQDENSTLTTSIGWGLLAEAYANFAIWGSIGLGAVLGWFFGLVARMSAKVPLMTFRGIIGVLTFGFAIQSEMTSGVWVGAYAQALIIVIGIRLVLMHRMPNPLANQQSNPHAATQGKRHHSVRRL
jgi:hypothetical protein